MPTLLTKTVTFHRERRVVTQTAPVVHRAAPVAPVTTAAPVAPVTVTAEPREEEEVKVGCLQTLCRPRCAGCLIKPAQ